MIKHIQYFTIIFIFTSLLLYRLLSYHDSEFIIFCSTLSVFFTKRKQTFMFLLQRYVNYMQYVYDKITLYLLSVAVIRHVVIYYHTFLLYFRYTSHLTITFIEQYCHMNIAAILLAMIASRFHIGFYLFIILIFFLRLDSSFVSMARFYKKHPYLIRHNFPKIDGARRGMWSRAAKIAEEAASNRKVQAVAAFGISVAAYRYADLKDTMHQREIADANREAENARAVADRSAEDTRHQKSLEAESVERQKDREAADALQQKALDRESVEREKDRIAESVERDKDRQQKTLDGEFSQKEDSSDNTTLSSPLEPIELVDDFLVYEYFIVSSPSITQVLIILFLLAKFLFEVFLGADSD